MKKSKYYEYSYQPINNVNQFIAFPKIIDSNKAFILFLHGGPGMSMSHSLDTWFEELRNDFNLVFWDQRGSGLSSDGVIETSTMRLKQLIEDCKAVSELVISKFKPEKMFLMGHSWGATLGIYTVNKYPDLYDGFISIGQWLIDDPRAVNSRIKYVKELSKTNQVVKDNLKKITLEIKNDFYWADDILKENGYDLSTETNTWDYHENLYQKSELYEKVIFFKLSFTT
jgi:pimeloyl-ACP methyl ester carboxylesterase